MQAVKLKGKVTENQRLVMEVPGEIPPGPVEVIVLFEEAGRPRKRGTGGPEKHPMFGMWADRPEAADPVDFTKRLRRGIERRKDSGG